MRLGLIGSLLGFLLCWFFNLPATAQYNMGAMWQGPKLKFTTTPSTTASASVAFATQPVVAVTNLNGATNTNESKSITLSAFTDSACTTAASGTLAATTNPLSTTSGSATFSGVSYPNDGTIYIKASAPGASSACFGGIAISSGGGGGGGGGGPDTTPTKFLISGATSIYSSTCTQYTVTLLNASNEPVAASSSISVSVTSTLGSGVEHSDSGCSSPQSSYTIAAGETNFTFYFSNSVNETNTITASDGTLTDGTIDVTTTAPPAAVNCGAAPPSSTGYQGTVYDDGGTADYNKSATCQYFINPTIGGKITVDITSLALASDGGDPLHIYDNSTNATPYATGTVALPLTTSTAPPTISYKTSSGDAFIELAKDGNSKTAAGFTISWKAYGADKLDYASGSTTPIDENACQQYTVERQNSGSTATTSPFSVTASLSTDSSEGLFYSDNNCSATTTSLFIGATASSAIVYYRDTKPGSWNLSVSDSAGVLDTGSQAVSVTEAVNDAPVAVNDSFTVDVDASLNITLSTDLFANDTDEEGDTLSLNAIDASSNQGGSIVDQGGGVYKYTPPASYQGADSFTYKIQDTSSAVSASGTVSIAVGVVSPPSSWAESDMIKAQDSTGSGTLTANERVGSGRSRGVTAYGDVMAMYGRGTVGTDQGAVYIIRDPNSDGDWSDHVLDKKLTSPNAGDNKLFGNALSFDGNKVLAVGEAGGGGVGLVYIYVDDDGDWSNHSGNPTATINVQTDFSRPGTAEGCGRYLVIRNGILIFGCPFNDDNDRDETNAEGTPTTDSGAVYIVQTSNNWSSYTPTAYLKGPTITASYRFGDQLDFDGTTLVVGNYESNTQDKIYVYRDNNSDGNWADVTLKDTLEDDDTGSADELFGYSFSIYNGMIAVGSINDDSSAVDAGAIYVFTDSNADLDWTKDIRIDGAATTNRLGVNVVISEAGLFEIDLTTRYVYVYEDPNTDGNWADASGPASIVPSGDSIVDDDFGGHGIYVDATTGQFQLFIGSPNEDSDNSGNPTGCTDCGAVYMFKPAP